MGGGESKRAELCPLVGENNRRERMKTLTERRRKMKDSTRRSSLKGR